MDPKNIQITSDFLNIKEAYIEKQFSTLLECLEYLSEDSLEADLKIFPNAVFVQGMANEEFNEFSFDDIKLDESKFFGRKILILITSTVNHPFYATWKTTSSKLFSLKYFETDMEETKKFLLQKIFASIFEDHDGKFISCIKSKNINLPII